MPKPQQEQCRQETFWRFELNPKLAKRVDADLQQPNWDDIQLYTNVELFENKFAQGFMEPANRDFPYYGISPSDLDMSIAHLSQKVNISRYCLPSIKQIMLIQRCIV